MFEKEIHPTRAEPHMNHPQRLISAAKCSSGSEHMFQQVLQNSTCVHIPLNSLFRIPNRNTIFSSNSSFHDEESLSLSVSANRRIKMAIRSILDIWNGI